MTPLGAADRGPSTASYSVAAAALGVLALACIWSPAAVPGTDLPSHAFFAAVLHDPGRWTGLVETNVPLTSQCFVWLTAALAGFGLDPAIRLALTLVAGATAGGFFAIGRELGDRRPLGLLFGIAATQTFYSAMGFANFAVAITCGLFAVAQALRAFRVRRPTSWIALAGWLLLTAYAHVIVAGMFGLHVLLLAALHPAAGNPLRRTGSAILAGVPAGAYALWVAGVAQAGYAAGGLSAGLSIQRLEWTEQLTGIGTLAFGGFTSLGPLVVLALFACVCQRAGFGEGRCGGRAVLAVSGLWLVGYFGIPFHGLGWAYAQPRMLVPAVVVAGAWTGWGARPRVTLWLTTGVIAAYLASTLAGLLPAGDRVANAIAALGDEPPGRAMEVVIDAGAVPTNRHITPLLHVAKYALANGGTSNHLPAFSAAIHSVRDVGFGDDSPTAPPLFVYRFLDCEQNPNCERQRVLLRQRIVAEGLRFDSALVVGADAAQRAMLRDCGYVQRGLDHFAPRPADAMVETTPPEAATRRTMVVRAGWPGGFGWIAGASRPPGAVDGFESIPVGPLPACAVVLEVTLERGEGDSDGDEQVLLRDRIELPAGREAALRFALPAVP